MKTQKEIGEIAARWWADRLEKSEYKEKFINEFVKLYEKHTPSIIKVDYDPDDFLFEVLENAGWKQESIMFSANGILPFKTLMKIKENDIVVSGGYGDEFSSLLNQLMKNPVRIRPFDTT